MSAQEYVLALRAVYTPQILKGEDEALLEELRVQGEPLGILRLGVMPGVGRTLEDDRERPLLSPWNIDLGVELDPVPHGDHHDDLGLEDVAQVRDRPLVELTVRVTGRLCRRRHDDETAHEKSAELHRQDPPCRLFSTSCRTGVIAC